MKVEVSRHAGGVTLYEAATEDILIVHSVRMHSDRFCSVWHTEAERLLSLPSHWTIA